MTGLHLPPRRPVPEPRWWMPPGVYALILRRWRRRRAEERLRHFDEFCARLDPPSSNAREHIF